MDIKKFRTKSSNNYKSVEYQNGILTIKSGLIENTIIPCEEKREEKPLIMKLEDLFNLSKKDLENCLDSTHAEMGSIALLGDSILRSTLNLLLITNYQACTAAYADIFSKVLANKTMAYFMENYTDLFILKPLCIGLSSHYIATYFEYLSGIFYMKGGDLITLLLIYLNSMYSIELDTINLPGYGSIPQELIIEENVVELDPNSLDHGLIIGEIQCPNHPNITLIIKTCAKYFPCQQTINCVKKNPCLKGNKPVKCLLCLKK